MADYFQSGRAIDVILGIVALEALYLTFRYRLTRSGIPPRQLLGQLIPGALLLLAVRSALTGAGWHYTALFLTLSLPAHLIDLALRTRAISGATWQQRK